MRFTTLRTKWESWVAIEEAKLRDDVPNRLHGATINERGEAI